MTQTIPTSAEPTDEDLVSGYLAGNNMAMDQLIRRYSPRLRRMIIAMLGADDAAVLDAEQEVFIALVRRIGRFKGRSSFSTFFYRLAKNKVIDLIRSRKRYDQRFLRLEEPYLAQSHSSNPETQTLDRGRAHLLHLAMSVVSEEDRILLYMKDGEDEPIGRLSEMTGLKPGTVKSRLSRARVKIAKKLEDMGYAHEY